MNWQFYFLQAQAKDPFVEISDFLTNTVVTGLLQIATPVAVLAFIGLGIASMLASDEHSRAKLKSGMWWVGGAAALCFMAQNIVEWLKGAF
jgi:hypothetical protein